MLPISLTVGELSRKTAEPVLQAATVALNQGLTHYSPVNGIYELRAALAEHYRPGQADIGPENIMITPGVRQAVYNVLANMISPGQEVLVLSPHWFAFPELIELVGGQIVRLHTHMEEDYHLSPRRLQAHLNERTRLFVFNNPCNPSGKVYSEEEIEALVEVLVKYPQVYILSDEIYEFVHYGQSVVPLGTWQAIADRCITVSGFSKAFAMAGWRVGYISASEKLIQRFRRFQEVSLSGVPVFTQLAALQALNTREAYLQNLMAELSQSRDEAFELLTSVPGLRVRKPEGAYYLFPDISAFLGKTSPGGRSLQTGADLAGYLMAECKVQVFSGDRFGQAQHLRLSYAMDPEAMREGFRRVAEGLGRLA